jgi:hypothetical protein
MAILRPKACEVAVVGQPSLPFHRRQRLDRLTGEARHDFPRRRQKIGLDHRSANPPFKAIDAKALSAVRRRLPP